MIFFLRARIETMSSISENLQCSSQRISETVANPYRFDDYLAEKRGIKEGGGGFRWQTQQPPSPAFPLPHDLYNLNPLGYASEESDFLKVPPLNLLSLSLSLYCMLLFLFLFFFFFWRLFAGFVFELSSFNSFYLVFFIFETSKFNFLTPVM